MQSVTESEGAGPSWARHRGVWIFKPLMNYNQERVMQVCLAIGIPVVFNFTMMVTFFILFNGNLNTRMHDLRNALDERFNALNQRFDDMRDLGRAELRRVGEVIARG